MELGKKQAPVQATRLENVHCHSELKARVQSRFVCACMASSSGVHRRITELQHTAAAILHNLRY